MHTEDSLKDENKTEQVSFSPGNKDPVSSCQDASHQCCFNAVTIIKLFIVNM